MDYGLKDVEAWIRKALEAAKTAHTPAPPAVVEEPKPVNGHASLIEADDEAWRERLNLIVTNSGDARPCLENAVQMLSCSDKFRLRYDEFACRPVFGDTLLPVEDEHMLLMVRWLQQQGIIVGSMIANEAVFAASQERRFHPVRDYLRGLKWDGTPRIDMILINHAGAADDEYTRAVTSKWMIQAVARIMCPGVQADTTIVLEGQQGIRKSTLLRVLFGTKWFTDHLPDLSTKDSLIQLLGVWCIEVAEFATLGRSDANRIKAFLTSPVDRFRPPHGRIAKDYPRQCVFAATVNPSDGYLKDPTGARRFWPVECNSEIDVDAVGKVRDQLWAEAYARFLTGEAWHLPKEILAFAEEQQEQRRENDPWEALISSFLVGKSAATVKEILSDCLGIPPERQSVVVSARVGKIMKNILRWKRRRPRKDGKPDWTYFRSEEGSAA